MSIYALMALRQYQMNAVAAETVGLRPFVTDDVKWLLIAHYADKFTRQERFVKAALAKGQLDHAHERTRELGQQIRAAITTGDEDRVRLLYREYVMFANVVSDASHELQGSNEHKPQDRHGNRK